MDVQNIDNIGSPLVFSHFFEDFWIPPKGSPLQLFLYFATQWMSKNPKGSPFYIFRYCDIVQKSNFQKFYLEIFLKSLNGPPLIFFPIFNQLEFHKAQSVPLFTILSLGYSADFGRSRLVVF